MPKIKTNRAAAKRFRRTGTGKYMFAKSHASHILTKKTRKPQKARRNQQVMDATNRKAVKRMLPYG